MFDASAFVGVWAFRAYPQRTAEHVVGALKAEGFRGACLSPVEAILHPEPMAANRAFFRDVAGIDKDGFVTVLAPVIDPTQAPWREHLAEVLELGGSAVRAVKIVPNYHVYSLAESPEVDALARELAERGLALAVQVRMEDERSRHPLMQSEGVPAADIAVFAERHPELPILLCGAYMAELRQLAPCANLSFELSFVESGRLLAEALQRVGAGRLLVGTHTPLFVTAVGAAKARADQTTPEEFQAIAQENFRRIFRLC